ncbi:hypothetical protein DSO57_1027896 [Entomophthora muscae]|uniref:Uncharacterized protein n=1 Tax=Entomophthora muscae TaxID=34485 RepID=A0ACC2UB86_9FUNG|nr:hypothetical protein DSO57_1027896 [Entomophthora muscae]
MSSSGYSATSNRQKKLQLQQVLKRDADPYQNQTPFRALERKFKRRVPPPDFSEIIDFQNLDKSPEEYRSRINRVELSEKLYGPLFGSGSEESSARNFGYTVEGFTGFIFISNPFSGRAQRNFIRESLREFTKPPYISNLDTHYVIPSCGAWNLFEQVSKGQLNEASEEYFVPLKLDPTKVKEGKQDAKLIDTSSATAGYQYNGLNEKGETIRNTHLEVLPPHELVKRLRWITFGYQYHWPTKAYIWNEAVCVPPALAELTRAVVGAIDGVKFEGESSWVHNYSKGDYKPEGGVFNFYQPRDSLMGHIDQSEPNLTAPLISYSFGCNGVFLMGGADRNTPPIPVLLRSGDIMAMCGPCRKAFHGVPRIIEDTLPEYLTSLASDLDPDEVQDWPVFASYLTTTRINANVRQVMPI